MSHDPRDSKCLDQRRLSPCESDGVVARCGKRSRYVRKNAVSERNTVNEHAEAPHPRPLFLLYRYGASANEELRLLVRERDFSWLAYLQLHSMTSKLANHSHPLDGRLGVLVRSFAASLA